MRLKLLLALCFALTTSANASPVQATRYSAFWSPISDQQTQVEVRRNTRDAIQLYSLWCRARLSGSIWYYAVALREVTQKQPANAVALSVYSLVLLDCRDYGATRNYQRAKADFGEDLQTAGIRRIIDKAKKLDPNQWPLWLAESRIVPFEDGQLNLIGKETEDFARHAVALSDNSFTNNELTYALLKRSVWDNDEKYLDQAITVAKRAQSLLPTNPISSVQLVAIYRDRKKNAVEKQRASQTVLATIPPNIKLSSTAKTYLKQKGIQLK